MKNESHTTSSELLVLLAFFLAFLASFAALMGAIISLVGGSK